MCLLEKVLGICREEEPCAPQPCPGGGEVGASSTSTRTAVGGWGQEKAPGNPSFCPPSWKKARRARCAR